MATDSNNMGNRYGKEGDGQATAATMAMGMGNTVTCATTGEMGMMVTMGCGFCVCFLCMWRDHKNKV
jgi:hypothetical protein